MREDQPGLQALLRRNLRRAIRGVPGHPYEHGFSPRLVPKKLIEPFLWSSRKTVFVNSMSDLFQAAVPDEYIAAVAEIMLSSPWHTYQVLTKRSDRLQCLLSGRLRRAAEARHIWWGVSVEDRKYGLSRIGDLRQTPAAVRFLSIEPLLEDLGEIDLSGIDWAIVGGESGAGARPMKEEWVETIRRQCDESNVRFFFKQWGGVRKSKRGRILNGRTYDDMPQPQVMPFPPLTVRRELARSFARQTQCWTAAPLVDISPHCVVA
jgi:protein gp37